MLEAKIFTISCFQDTAYAWYVYNMYKVVENQKCTKWPQTELEYLTVKSTL